MELGKKLNWLVWLLLLPICLFPLNMIQAQDEPENQEESGDWLLGDGKGSTEEGAIVAARCAALMKYLKKNMQSEDFNTHEATLLGFVQDNWREYCEGVDTTPYFVKPYENRAVRIMVKVRGDALLKDTSDKVLRAGEKLQGIEISVQLDSGKKSGKDSDVMLDTIASELGKHFTIRNVKAANKADEMENKVVGISAEDDPTTYELKKFDLIKVPMYFWLKTKKVFDEATDQNAYTVTIGARGIFKWTGQELFRFQHKRTGADRIQTIKKVAYEVALEIVSKVGTFSNIMPQQVYIVKFVNFSRAQDRDKIQQAMLDMAEGKKSYMQILQGGEAAGPSYFSYRIKWLKNHSQFAITRIILEMCLHNEVRVKCNKFSPGIMIYEPPESNWVESGGEKPEVVEEPEEEAPEEGTIEVVGKGSSKQGAITAAIKKALLDHAKANLEAEDFNAHKAAIESIIANNYKQYVDGDPIIVKSYNEDTRKITIRIKIKGDELLNDIQSQLLSPQEKLAGMSIFVLHDKEPVKAAKDEWLDHDVAFDTFQDVMTRYGATFYNPKAAKEALKQTERVTGLSSVDDPSLAAYRNFILDNLDIFLMVKTDLYEEGGDSIWQATISGRCVWKQSGQEFFRFQVRSGDKAGEFGDKYVPKAYRNTNKVLTERDARSRAIKDLAVFVGEEAATRVANQKALRANNYVFKFIGFKPTDRDKIESALEDLSSGSRPKLKIVNASKVGEALELKATWKMTAHSPNKIAQIIKEICAENEVNARPDFMVRGMITFVPGK